MSRPSAPSMPTKRQVTEAHETVVSLYPNARIKAVGPEGVSFEYPPQNVDGGEWEGRPFEADQS